MTRGTDAVCRNVLFGNDDEKKKKKKKKTHPDTKEHCDKTDGDGEEKKEHEEPGTPVQPVAEAHHPHVLLQATGLGKKGASKSGLKKKKKSVLLTEGLVQTHLELPFLLLDHRPHDVEGRVGEAEHQQQGQLVLDGQDEDVVPVGREGEA